MASTFNAGLVRRVPAPAVARTDGAALSRLRLRSSAKSMIYAERATVSSATPGTVISRVSPFLTFSLMRFIRSS